MYITFGHMLEVGIHRLEEAKIADAKRDAETLLLYLEKADRTFLYVHRNDATDEYRADAYFGLIDRRAAGEPLQYILGSQEFMGLEFCGQSLGSDSPPGYGDSGGISSEAGGREKKVFIDSGYVLRERCDRCLDGAFSAKSENHSL